MVGIVFILFLVLSFLKSRREDDISKPKLVSDWKFTNSRSLFIVSTLEFAATKWRRKGLKIWSRNFFSLVFRTRKKLWKRFWDGQVRTRISKGLGEVETRPSLPAVLSPLGVFQKSFGIAGLEIS